NRIFLSGFSSGTEVVSKLMEREPELWRGAALNSPVRFPQLNASDFRFPAVFISIGEKDSAPRLEMVQKFGMAACGRQIPVTTIYHANAGHIFAATESNVERYYELANFIRRLK
ncbi:MAG: hypothetical protein K0Q55_3379, partial [Verrucomicrobia bacterium]|nr:hypothetical protein [Verrucomicrobiota bacterium]